MEKCFILSYGRRSERYDEYYIPPQNWRLEHVQANVRLWLREAASSVLAQKKKLSSDFFVLSSLAELLREKGYRKAHPFSISLETFWKPILQDHENESVIMNVRTVATGVSFYELIVYPAAEHDNTIRLAYRFNEQTDKFVKLVYDVKQNTLLGNDENLIAALSEKLADNGFIPMEFDELFMPCTHRISDWMAEILGEDLLSEMGYTSGKNGNTGDCGLEKNADTAGSENPF